MSKRQIIYIIFTFTLVSMIGFSKFLGKVPTVPCENWGFVSFKTAKSYIYPEKVIVNPWFGQHKIYAIFIVPNGHLYDNFITINLGNNHIFCGDVSRLPYNQDGVIAKPGYDLAKGYLHTRTGIKFILAGKINEIRKASNWQLGVARDKNN
ncbi:MAG: hypothetical protein ACKPFD_11860 [Dolichospermum sp.]